MKKLKTTILAYLFLLPALILLLVFTLYPMLKSVQLSFYKYNMIKTTTQGKIAPPEFRGGKNFAYLAKDPLLKKSLYNSLLYLLIVPFIQILAILIAILVNRQTWGINFFRVAYYVPVITSIVVVGIAWRWLFAGDGLLNFLLVKKFALFSSGIGWLTDPRIALFSVMFVTLWQGLGYYMVLYLAGLQSINSETLDAAKVDGSNSFQLFWSVLLPLLKPTVALCAIISSIAALKVFGEIYVMTTGGPESSTTTLAYYIFIKAFQEFDMGYASALALFLAVIVGIISFLNLHFFKRGGIEYY